MADDPDLVPEREYAPTLAAPIAGTIAPAPYSFEFSGEDSLRLTVYNSVSGVRVSVQYRVHREGATTHASSQTFAPASTRLASSIEFTIGRGYLLNVTIYASSGAPAVGQTFARLDVIRGRGEAAIVLGTVCQDYITAQQPIAWPGSPLRSSMDGEPPLRWIVGTTPAVGVEVLETCPTGARWELIAANWQFVTSAAAGDRRSRFYIGGPGGFGMQILPPSVQVAGDNLPYKWAPGLVSTYLAATGMQAPIMTRPIMMAGGQWGSQTQGLQAADFYVSISYAVREWLEAQ